MQQCRQHDLVCCLTTFSKPRFFSHSKSTVHQPCSEQSPRTTDLSQWSTPPVEHYAPRHSNRMQFIQQTQDRRGGSRSPPRDIVAARGSAPMLQSPRPRATWRRSLQEPLSSKREEYLDDLEVQNRRVTFEISCALPPLYLDRPPEYNTNDFPIQTPPQFYSWSRASTPDRECRTYLNLQQCLPPSPWGAADFTALPTTISTGINTDRRQSSTPPTHQRKERSSRLQHSTRFENNDIGQSSAYNTANPPQRPPKILRNHRRGTPSR